MSLESHILRHILNRDKLNFRYSLPSASWFYTAKNNMYPKINEHDKDLFEQIQQKYFHASVFKGLIDVTLPPFLAAKYHRMGIKTLPQAEDKSCEDYLELVMWYMLYCQTFGLQYLSDIHKKNASSTCTILPKYDEEYYSIFGQEMVAMFIVSNSIVLKGIGECTLLKCAPSSKNCAKKSLEFLLNPAIIIQLPWHTVIFHQWLVAAIYDTLNFEKHTLELRHWSIPQNLESIAKELLYSVRVLKERILLGFLILTQQIQIYPDSDSKHPAWILDHVVLPSLPILNFINSSGIGIKILHYIKVKSWQKSESSATNRVYIPSSIYNANSDLLQTFLEFSCYGQIYWLIRAPSALFYLKKKRMTVSVETIIDNIGCLTSENDAEIKKATLTEMFYILEANNALNKNEMHQIAKEVVKKEILDKNRIPVENKNEVLSLFWGSDLNSKEFCEKSLSEEYLKQFHLHCFLQAKLRNKLFDQEEQKSIMWKILLLGIQITEREQIVRITNMICLQIGITPIDINATIYKSKLMTYTTIENELKLLNSQITDRNWLWSQFPMEYRLPVLSSVHCNTDENIDTFIKNCENRIGKIVLSTAQNGFEVYENGGEIFPYWMHVQYMLPCYVAIFVNRINKATKHFINKKRVMEFLDGIIKFYEILYITWQGNKQKRKISDIKSAKCEDLTKDLWQIYHKLRCYMDDFNLMLICHICKLSGSALWEIEGFFNLPCLDWFIVKENKRDTEGMEFYKMWTLKSLDLYKILFEVCINVWQYPSIKQRKLPDMYSELHDANELLKTMHYFILCTLTTDSGQHQAQRKREHMKELIEKRKFIKDCQLYKWQISFVKSIITAQTEHLTQKHINEIQIEGKSVLLKFYKILKSLKLGRLNVKNQQLDYLPKLSQRELLFQEYLNNGDFKSIETMFPCLFPTNKHLNLNSNLLPLQLENKLQDSENVKQKCIKSQDLECASSSSYSLNYNQESKSSSVRIQTSKGVHKRRKTNSFGGLQKSFLNNSVIDSAQYPAHLNIEKVGTKLEGNNLLKYKNESCKLKTETLTNDNKSTFEKSNTIPSYSVEKEPITSDNKYENTTISNEDTSLANITKIENKEKYICRNCSKEDKEDDTFLICKKCVKDKYPDINYFCSKECENSWWKIEHMAEHLEFDLGLLDLNKFK